MDSLNQSLNNYKNALEAYKEWARLSKELKLLEACLRFYNKPSRLRTDVIKTYWDTCRALKFLEGKCL